MADKKISGLTAASTPLAGTEVLPIVQSGATVKIAISNVTAGRAVSGTQFTASTGNFIVGTAGKGIDFSANTGAAGMTSELLTWYEEGTWTPVITSTTGAITSYTVYSATYTRVGRMVHIVLQFAVLNNGTGAGALAIAGLPFAAGAATCGMTYNQSTGESGTFTVATSATSGSSVKYNNAYPVATGQTLQFNLTYSA